MARLYSRTGKRGTVWYADYSVAGRRVRKRLGKSKRLAKAALVRIQRNQQGVVILSLAEYQDLLSRAGRPRMKKRSRKVLSFM